MLLPDVGSGTEHELFLDFSDFSHGTHVKFGVFIQVTGDYDNFELHGF